MENNQQPRQLTAEEVRELKENATPSFSMAFHQVRGGFKVQGQIAWSKDGNMVAMQNDEAVAPDLKQVLHLVKVYFDAAGWDTYPQAVPDHPDFINPAPQYPKPDPMPGTIDEKEFESRLRGTARSKLGDYDRD